MVVRVEVRVDIEVVAVVTVVAVRVRVGVNDGVPDAAGPTRESGWSACHAEASPLAKNITAQTASTTAARTVVIFVLLVIVNTPELA